MIFQTFNDEDIVAGRTTRVASGFWPYGLTNASQSSFVNDFWDLTTATNPSPSYGTSIYDIRRTMYYLNVYPDSTTYLNNDPHFSISYGHIAGNVGSGSFATDTASIQAYAAKTVYTQYLNQLLGTADLDGMFTMDSGSTTVNAEDIWVINFSSYKMKDRIDEGMLELSFSGSNGTITLIDNSYVTSQAQSSYQLIEGTLDSQPASPTYAGLGIFYPQNGIIILNAALLAEKVGIPQSGDGIAPNTNGPASNTGWWYNPNVATTEYTYNHETLFRSMWLCGNSLMKVRKSEDVPARHYFVRVKNRNFNYSNNPSYVYDGTDGIHAKGTIRNSDFITDPRTYITTIGLYDKDNELIAVAKLSRPFVKTFDSEILFKCRLDF